MRILLFALGLGAGFHPLHTTHTDLAEGPGGRVTLTIRSFSDDLHAAVLKREAAVADSAVARYVRSTVVLRDRAGHPVSLLLDSVRTEGDITRIVLHATLPSGLRGATVSQLMQMELYEDQVNVLQSSAGGRQTSLLFLPGDGPKPLP
jgi:hypothetical protein